MINIIGLPEENKVADQKPQLGRDLYESCPLCDADIGKSEMVKVGDCLRHPLFSWGLDPKMLWLKCGECGHVFTDGTWSKDAQAVIFSRILPSQTVGHDYERQRFVAAKMIDRVFRTGFVYESGIPSTWLDVGFGNGALALTAQEYGFDVTGLDLRQKNVELLREYGVMAECGDLCGLNDLTYDVISMCDVLEHTARPREMLQAARRRMKTGCRLLVSMPNMESPVWTMLDARNENPYWNEMEHYHNFGRSTLYRILKETGFRPLRYGISVRYRACMEVVAEPV